MKKISGWLKDYALFALIFAAILAVTGLAWRGRLEAETFPEQRQMQDSMMPLHTFMLFVNRTFEGLDEVARGAALFAVAFGVGLVLVWLWRRDNPLGKVAVIALAAVNVMYGAFVVLSVESVTIRFPRTECDLGAGVRLIAYPIHEGARRYQNLFVLADGEQIAYFHDGNPALDCEKAGALSADFFWRWNTDVRHQSALAVTHDGGESWEVWEIGDALPDFEGRNVIESVTFTDAESGEMAIRLGWPDAEEAIFLTGDGGLTWARAE